MSQDIASLGDAQSVMSKEDEAVKQNDIVQDFLYKKRGGTCRTEPQLFRIKLLSLILFKGLVDENIEELYLDANILNIGVFSEICYRYVLRNELNHKLIFMKVMYKDDLKNPDYALKLEDLTNEASEFNLAEYFDSYKVIEKSMCKNNRSKLFDCDPNVDCVFIICATLGNTIPDSLKTRSKSHQIDNVLRMTGQTGDIFQIKDDDLISTITLDIIRKQIKALGKLLKCSILSNNDKQYSTLMNNDLIKKYHVILAQKVVNVLDIKTTNKGNCRKGTFRKDFLTAKEGLLLLLWENIFESSTNVIDDYNPEKFAFKLPVLFGNVDLPVKKSKHVGQLAEDLKKLLEGAKNFEVEIDDNIFQNNRIEMMIGNVLILDDTDAKTETLKFSALDDMREGNAKNVIAHLLDTANISEYQLNSHRFKVKMMGDFPKLSLLVTHNDKRQIDVFFKKLWFFTRQPKESTIELNLKEVVNRHCKSKEWYKSTLQTDTIALFFYEEVEKWWLEENNTCNCLTKECKFFEIAQGEISSSHYLRGLDTIFKHRIVKNGIKFKDAAIHQLNIDGFLSGQTDNILYITTDDGFLTMMKLAQYFKNRSSTIFLDLDSATKKHCYRSVKFEVKDTKFTTIVIFYKEPNVDKLYDIIENLSSKHVIVVSELDITRDLEAQFNIICILKTDKAISLNNIMDNDTATENWTITFQGQKKKFDDVIDENARHLICSKVLRKLINGETVEIGKPPVHSSYDETIDYFITRYLMRDEPLEINTLKGIDDNIVILSGSAGVGKSVLLSQLAVKTSAEFRRTWIVYIDLLDTTEFERWRETGNMNLTEVLKFVSKASMKEFNIVSYNDSNWKRKEKHLTHLKFTVQKQEIDLKIDTRNKVSFFELQLFLHYYKNGDVIFILDAFDQTALIDYEKEIIALINMLTKDNKKELLGSPMSSNFILSDVQRKVWITTRRCKKGKTALENGLSHKSYTILPLSKPDQDTYIRKYMETNFIINFQTEEIANINAFCEYLHILIEEKILVNEINEPLYFLYISAMEHIKNQSDKSDIQVIRDKCAVLPKLKSYASSLVSAEKLFKNPRFLSIGVKYFLKQINDLKTIPSSKAEIINKWDLSANSLSLIEYCIISIRQAYLDLIQINQNISDNEDWTPFTDFLGLENLSLRAVFSDEDLLRTKIVSDGELLEIRSKNDEIDSGADITGFVEEVIDGKPKFVHVFFAEYFAARYLCNKLKCTIANKATVWQFIVESVLCKGSNGLCIIFDRKLKNDSDLIKALDCDRNRAIVFEAILSRARNDPSKNFEEELLRNFKENRLTNLVNYLSECILYGLRTYKLDKKDKFTSDSLLKTLNSMHTKE